MKFYHMNSDRPLECGIICEECVDEHQDMSNLTLVNAHGISCLTCGKSRSMNREQFVAEMHKKVRLFDEFMKKVCPEVNEFDNELDWFEQFEMFVEGHCLIDEVYKPL